MATIRSTIELYDRITAPVVNMVSALNNLCGAYEAADAEMNDTFDPSRIDSARAAIDQAAQQVDACRQEIEESVQAQEDFNEALNQGANNAAHLGNLIGKATSALGAFFGIRKIIDFTTDSMSAFDTQLNAEIQLMTVLGNMVDSDYVLEVMTETNVDSAIADINSVEARIAAVSREFEAITSKAADIQGRGIYGDEIMIAGAAELSTYFTDTDAIEMMMDTLTNYAMGMSGGGALDSTAMTNYATGLGKIMSGAYDAMTKKGFEFTDAQKAVIEGTATEAEYIAVLGEQYEAMSEDMRAATAITQVVDESWSGLYETMSNTPQAKIIKLNNAWGDMQEAVGGKLYTSVAKIYDVIEDNWSTIEEIIEAATAGIETIVEILSVVLDIAFSVAQAIIDNWSWIEPIIYGIAAGLAVYYTYLLIVNTATTIATAAQWLLNAAMNANPAGAVALAVGALVGAFGLYINATNEAYGTSMSLAGMIGGSLMVVLAGLGNIVIMIANIVAECIVVIWNLIVDLVNFLGNIFLNPLRAIVQLFTGVFDAILSIIEAVAGAIGKLFGQDWSSGIADFRQTMWDAVNETYGENEEYLHKLDLHAFDTEYIDYDEAFDAGYYIGEDLANKMGGTNEATTAYDAVEKMLANTDTICEDTANIADSIEMTNEELKYLRDIAERDVINRFTTAEVTIEWNNTQNINSDMDLDGVMDYFTSNLQEAIESTAEGVHV